MGYFNNILNIKLSVYFELDPHLVVVHTAK